MRRISKSLIASAFHAIWKGDNRVINKPKLKSSRIIFEGKGNVLYCTQPDVVIEDSIIRFMGDNSLVFLCPSKWSHKLKLAVFNDSVVYIGKNNKVTSLMAMVASEQKHIFIGNSGLFSRDIWFRTADPHLIYSTESKERINWPQSIFLGDHVWIGQGVSLLKGTQIGSGTIVGAGSVVAGKKLTSNCSYAGVPVKKLREGIFFTTNRTHDYTKEQQEASGIKNTRKWIYTAESAEAIPFSNIDEMFSQNVPVDEKIAYIVQNLVEGKHNRFYLPS